jgi:splicing factor 3B subunit 2
MVALTDLEIQVRAQELGLSTFGTRSTLLELIKEKEAALLKESNMARDDLKKKKRLRRRKKKRVTNEIADEAMEDSSDVTVEIEYVPDKINLDSEFSEFSKIFKQFQEPGKDVEEEPVQGLVVDDTPDLEDLEDEPQDKPMSKKKMKLLNRPSVAMLKKVAFMPEVVDWVDVTASDPFLLIQLKSTRNTIPVPVHWSQKKRYLGGKRGFEKIPFELPQYIKDTGIMEMRNAMIERDEAAGLKGRTRARMKPKLGRLDIDYQKLHDAFFKYQTKPAMTKYGDMYYEGKEFAANVQLKRPGSLSEDLKNALNIPPGAPPPWLLNMQRYGPPPAYPNLKIPGLNAPIPEGAQWGYHPGGWGKPPVDELNRPLYGDVFGMVKAPVKSKSSENIDKTLWGELESEPEAEEELEEEEEEEEEEEVEETEKPIEEINVSSGIETPLGGMETPTNIELRKRYFYHV